MSNMGVEDYIWNGTLLHKQRPLAEIRAQAAVTGSLTLPDCLHVQQKIKFEKFAVQVLPQDVQDNDAKLSCKTKLFSEGGIGFQPCILHCDGQKEKWSRFADFLLKDISVGVASVEGRSLEETSVCLFLIPATLLQPYLDDETYGSADRLLGLFSWRTEDYGLSENYEETSDVSASAPAATSGNTYSPESPSKPETENENDPLERATIKEEIPSPEKQSISTDNSDSAENVLLPEKKDEVVPIKEEIFVPVQIKIEKDSVQPSCMCNEGQPQDDNRMNASNQDERMNASNQDERTVSKLNNADPKEKSPEHRKIKTITKGKKIKKTKKPGGHSIAHSDPLLLKRAIVRLERLNIDDYKSNYQTKPANKKTMPPKSKPRIPKSKVAITKKTTSRNGKGKKKGKKSKLLSSESKGKDESHSEAQITSTDLESEVQGDDKAAPETSYPTKMENSSSHDDASKSVTCDQSPSKLAITKRTTSRNGKGKKKGKKSKLLSSESEGKDESHSEAQITSTDLESEVQGDDKAALETSYPTKMENSSSHDDASKSVTCDQSPSKLVSDQKSSERYSESEEYAPCSTGNPEESLMNDTPELTSEEHSSNKNLVKDIQETSVENNSNVNLMQGSPEASSEENILNENLIQGTPEAASEENNANENLEQDTPEAASEENMSNERSMQDTTEATSEENNCQAPAIMENSDCEKMNTEKSEKETLLGGVSNDVSTKGLDQEENKMNENTADVSSDAIINTKEMTQTAGKLASTSSVEINSPDELCSKFSSKVEESDSTGTMQGALSDEKLPAFVNNAGGIASDSDSSNKPPVKSQEVDTRSSDTGNETAHPPTRQALEIKETLSASIHDDVPIQEPLDKSPLVTIPLKLSDCDMVARTVAENPVDVDQNVKGTSKSHSPPEMVKHAVETVQQPTALADDSHRNNCLENKETAIQKNAVQSMKKVIEKPSIKDSQKSDKNDEVITEGSPVDVVQKVEEIIATQILTKKPTTKLQAQYPISPPVPSSSHRQRRLSSKDAARGENIPGKLSAHTNDGESHTQRLSTPQKTISRSLNETATVVNVTSPDVRFNYPSFQHQHRPSKDAEIVENIPGKLSSHTNDGESRTQRLNMPQKTISRSLNETAKVVTVTSPDVSSPDVPNYPSFHHEHRLSEDAEIVENIPGKISAHSNDGESHTQRLSTPQKTISRSLNETPTVVNVTSPDGTSPDVPNYPSFHHQRRLTKDVEIVENIPGKVSEYSNEGESHTRHKTMPQKTVSRSLNETAKFVNVISPDVPLSYPSFLHQRKLSKEAERVEHIPGKVSVHIKDGESYTHETIPDKSLGDRKVTLVQQTLPKPGGGHSLARGVQFQEKGDGILKRSLQHPTTPGQLKHLEKYRQKRMLPMDSHHLKPKAVCTANRHQSFQTYATKATNQSSHHVQHPGHMLTTSHEAPAKYQKRPSNLIYPTVTDSRYATGHKPSNTKKSIYASMQLSDNQSRDPRFNKHNQPKSIPGKRQPSTYRPEHILETSNVADPDLNSFEDPYDTNYSVIPQDDFLFHETGFQANTGLNSQLRLPERRRISYKEYVTRPSLQTTEQQTETVKMVDKGISVARSKPMKSVYIQTNENMTTLDLQQIAMKQSVLGALNALITSVRTAMSSPTQHTAVLTIEKVIDIISRTATFDLNNDGEDMPSAMKATKETKTKPDKKRNIQVEKQKAVKELENKPLNPLQLIQSPDSTTGKVEEKSKHPNSREHPEDAETKDPTVPDVILVEANSPPQLPQSVRGIAANKAKSFNPNQRKNEEDSGIQHRPVSLTSKSSTGINTVQKSLQNKVVKDGPCMSSPMSSDTDRGRTLEKNNMFQQIDLTKDTCDDVPLREDKKSEPRNQLSGSDFNAMRSIELSQIQLSSDTWFNVAKAVNVESNPSKGGIKEIKDKEKRRTTRGHQEFNKDIDDRETPMSEDNPAEYQQKNINPVQGGDKYPGPSTMSQMNAGVDSWPSQKPSESNYIQQCTTLETVEDCLDQHAYFDSQAEWFTDDLTSCNSQTAQLSQCASYTYSDQAYSQNDSGYPSRQPALFPNNPTDNVSHGGGCGGDRGFPFQHDMHSGTWSDFQQIDNHAEYHQAEYSQNFQYSGPPQGARSDQTSVGTNLGQNIENMVKEYVTSYSNASLQNAIAQLAKTGLNTGRFDQLLKGKWNSGEKGIQKPGGDPVETLLKRLLIARQKGFQYRKKKAQMLAKRRAGMNSQTSQGQRRGNFGNHENWDDRMNKNTQYHDGRRDTPEDPKTIPAPLRQRATAHFVNGRYSGYSIPDKKIIAKYNRLQNNQKRQAGGSPFSRNTFDKQRKTPGRTGQKSSFKGSNFPSVKPDPSKYAPISSLSDGNSSCLSDTTCGPGKNNNTYSNNQQTYDKSDRDTSIRISDTENTSEEIKGKNNGSLDPGTGRNQTECILTKNEMPLLSKTTTETKVLAEDCLERPMVPKAHMKRPAGISSGQTSNHLSNDPERSGPVPKGKQTEQNSQIKEVKEISVEQNNSCHGKAIGSSSTTPQHCNNGEIVAIDAINHSLHGVSGNDRRSVRIERQTLTFKPGTDDKCKIQHAEQKHTTSEADLIQEGCEYISSEEDDPSKDVPSNIDKKRRDCDHISVSDASDTESNEIPSRSRKLVEDSPWRRKTQIPNKLVEQMQVYNSEEASSDCGSDDYHSTIASADVEHWTQNRSKKDRREKECLPSNRMEDSHLPSRVHQPFIPRQVREADLFSHKNTEGFKTRRNTDRNIPLSNRGTRRKHLSALLPQITSFCQDWRRWDDFTERRNVVEQWYIDMDNMRQGFLFVCSKRRRAGSYVPWEGELVPFEHAITKFTNMKMASAVLKYLSVYCTYNLILAEYQRVEDISNPDTFPAEVIAVELGNLKKCLNSCSYTFYKALHPCQFEENITDWRLKELLHQMENHCNSNSHYVSDLKGRVLKKMIPSTLDIRKEKVQVKVYISKAMVCRDNIIWYYSDDDHGDHDSESDYSRDNSRSRAYSKHKSGGHVDRRSYSEDSDSEESTRSSSESSGSSRKISRKSRRSRKKKHKKALVKVDSTTAWSDKETDSEDDNSDKESSSDCSKRKPRVVSIVGTEDRNDAVIQKEGTFLNEGTSSTFTKNQNIVNSSNEEKDDWSTKISHFLRRIKQCEADSGQTSAKDASKIACEDIPLPPPPGLTSGPVQEQGVPVQGAEKRKVSGAGAIQIPSGKRFKIGGKPSDLNERPKISFSIAPKQSGPVSKLFEGWTNETSESCSEQETSGS